ncbi:hypothetical protein STEG23_012607 [Scotinomys teguina]
MEADAEIHSQTPGQAPGVQLKKEKKDSMSKGHQDHDEETYRDSQTKLVGTHGPIAVESPWDWTRLSV